MSQFALCCSFHEEMILQCVHIRYFSCILRQRDVRHEKEGKEPCVLAKILRALKKRSDVPAALSSFYRDRIIRTAAVQGLGRMNSEAIKILTPLLPIRPLVEYFIGPFLPLVFRVQFGYCYSFCPAKMPAAEARRLADDMRERHAAEAEVAWAQAAKEGLAIEGVENKHENIVMEVK